MASIVERGPGGIIYKCPTVVDVPYEDVLTFLFGEWAVIVGLVARLMTPSY